MVVQEWSVIWRESVKWDVIYCINTKNNLPERVHYLEARYFQCRLYHLFAICINKKKSCSKLLFTLQVLHTVGLPFLSLKLSNEIY